MTVIRPRRTSALIVLALSAISAGLLTMALIGVPAIADRLDRSAERAIWSAADKPEPSDSIVVVDFDADSNQGGLSWYRNPMYWAGVIRSADASDAAALVLDESFAEPFVGIYRAEGMAGDDLSGSEQSLFDAINNSAVPIILAAQQQPDGGYLVPFSNLTRPGFEQPLLAVDEPLVAITDRGVGSRGAMSSYNFSPAVLEIGGESLSAEAVPMATLRALGVDDASLDAIPDEAPLSWYGAAGSFETESANLLTTGQPLPVLEDKIIVFGGANDAGKVDRLSTLAGDAVTSAEVQATALSNVLNGELNQAVPGWTKFAVGIALAACAFLGLAILRPWLGVPLVVAAFAGWIIAAIVLYEQHVVVPVASALVIGVGGAIGVGVALVVLGVRDRLRIKGMFARYVSPDVVNELAESDDPIKLGGESREITVLFADIRGFTSLSENADPEEMVSELNAYYTEMVQVIINNGGTLDKFLGDGLMAIFGAPVNREDHAERACRAAIEMLEQLEQLNEVRAAMGKEPLHIGVGVHTGQAVVGNIGSPLFRVDFTAIGDTVNLASRLDAATKDVGCDVLVSSDTVAAVGDAMSFNPRGTVVVKGRTQATEIFVPSEIAAAADGDLRAG